MKNFRFYLEFETPSLKRKRKNTGNVLAVAYKNYWKSGKDYLVEAIGGVQNTPNSEVCATSTQYDYLRKNCLRIPECIARIIHPNLFYVLDQSR